MAPTGYQAREIINFVAQALDIALTGWWIGARVARWHASATPEDDHS